MFPEPKTKIKLNLIEDNVLIFENDVDILYLREPFRDYPYNFNLYNTLVNIISQHKEAFQNI